MSKEELLQMDGEVVKIVSADVFKVKLSNGREIPTKLSGKMRRFHIRVLTGDQVTVGLSPYDLSHGLILYRKKQ